MLEVNLIAAALLAQRAVEPMIAARWGRVVNLASFVGQVGNFGQANDAASKAALVG